MINMHCQQKKQQSYVLTEQEGDVKISDMEILQKPSETAYIPIVQNHKNAILELRDLNSLLNELNNISCGSLAQKVDAALCNSQQAKTMATVASSEADAALKAYDILYNKIKNMSGGGIDSEELQKETATRLSVDTYLQSEIDALKLNITDLLNKYNSLLIDVESLKSYCFKAIMTVTGGETIYSNVANYTTPHTVTAKVSINSNGTITYPATEMTLTKSYTDYTGVTTSLFLATTVSDNLYSYVDNSMNYGKSIYTFTDKKNNLTNTVTVDIVKPIYIWFSPDADNLTKTGEHYTTNINSFSYSPNVDFEEKNYMFIAVPKGWTINESKGIKLVDVLNLSSYFDVEKVSTTSDYIIYRSSGRSGDTSSSGNTFLSLQGITVYLSGTGNF